MLHWLIFVTLLFFVHYASSCPEECRCTSRFGKRKVDCSSEGLRSIPPLNEHTNILDLSSNPISELGSEVFKKMNLFQLEDINLSGHSVDKVHVDAFRGLENLRSLDLSKSRLTKLHNETFKGNGKLSTLFLRQNPFLDLPQEGSFLDIPSLTFLDLGQSNLNHVPEDTFMSMKGLKTILLDNNEIHNLTVHTFSELVNLTYLDLSGNKINNIYPTYFLFNARLKTLLLNKNPLKLDQGIKFTPFALLYPPDLSLRSGPFIYSASVEYLDLSDALHQMIPGDFFCKMPNLKRINLSRSFLFRIQTVHFSCLSKLEEVDMSYSNILSMDVEAFEKNHRLDKLNLTGNIWGGSLISSGSFGLQSTSLKYLDFRSNLKYKFTSYEFSQVTNITHLTLNSNILLNLDNYLLSFLHDLEYLDASSAALVTINPYAFKANRKLRQLSLKNNILTGLTNVSEVFNIPTLEVLDLSLCELTNITEDAFANAPGLKELDLSGNPFLFLPDNLFLRLSSLQTLDLTRCQLSAFHPRMLRGNKELVNLYLRENPIHGIAHGDSFESHSKLQLLDLSSCELYRLQSSTFSKLTSLKKLYLNHNILKTLDVTTLDPMMSLTNLGLAGNHWRCDCRLKHLLHWTLAHGVVTEDMVFCREPEDMVGWTWYQAGNDSCGGMHSGAKICKCNCNEKQQRSAESMVPRGNSDSRPCSCPSSSGVAESMSPPSSQHSGLLAFAVISCVVSLACIAVGAYFVMKYRFRRSTTIMHRNLQSNEQTVSVANLLVSDS